MISVKNKEPQIYYGSKTIKEVYKGSTKIYPSIDQQAIMDSLVCWYDIGKQQCTNESMAANPVLADLSGNGHDITCYNFAWSGMSGIGGGYFYDESNYEASSNYGTIKGNIIKITKWVNGVSAFHSRYVYGEKGKPLQLSIPAITIKVSGLPDGYNLDVSYIENRGNGVEYFSIKRDIVNGFTTLEAREINIEPYSENSTCYFRDMQFSMDGGKGTASAPEDVDITIEILPLYPNALVSDGVDDYAYVEGLPILTDYTVIAKRKILTDKVSALVSKATDNNSTDGAFIFDAKNGSGYIACNFGANNPLAELYPEDVSYQTKESYNGSPIIKLNRADTDKLSLFTFSALKNLVGQYALYSFLLFDRTLTTAEIEWVKKNMIESGGVLKTDWKRDPWHDWDRIIGSISSNKLVINGINNTRFFEVNASIDFASNPIPSYKVKITGVRDDLFIRYGNHSNNDDMVTMKKDGIYILPEINENYGGFYTNKTFENENIVIQQLLS